MKSLIMICMLMMHAATSVIHWENDFDKAKQTASADKKLILLNFSGSDWCGPCIRLHKEVFESPAFAELAEKRLVLVNADFPRLKKNQLSKQQQEQNEKLADKYNSSGSFPLTVLLTSDGEFIRSWEGYPKDGVASFIEELNAAINGVS